ncbi:MAG: glycosyltransferase [Propionicimonas sp.]
MRQVLRCEQPFQTVVVCGRNDELKAQVDDLVASRPERFRVLGYTTEMADLMRISCLFVGKPGGLSSSECMAAGLPMVLIKPIPGQEVRNADYLLEEGAAVRCNYPTTVGYKIDRLLADPERLAAMAANARRIGFPDAARTIAEQSLAAPAAPLWISRDAQKSISKAGEDGVAAVDLPDGARLRTLADPATGESLAVFSQAQLEILGVTPLSRMVELDVQTVKALRWQPENLDLAVAGKWLLGEADARAFSLD